MVRNLIFSLILLLVPTTVFAISLDAAKEGGLVGETPSGYLEATAATPSAEVASLVKEVNKKRLAEYTRISKEGGPSLTLKQVETLAGNKAIQLTKPGNLIKTQDGKWEKK